MNPDEGPKARTAVENTLSAILTIAAVVIAAVLVKREFFPAATTAASASSPAPARYEEQWQDFLAIAEPAGGAKAPAVLIEFGDLECPACAAFHLRTLRDVKAEFGNQVDFRFVHWPLARHRFARPAAEAAECAARQGRFSEFLDAVFPRQDSLGLRPWSRFAQDALIPDSGAFTACLLEPDKLRARIDAGTATAEGLGFEGTPTIVLNGWRFASPPPSARLRAAITNVLAGKDPEP